MSQDVETIVRRWFDEVWNQGREETIDELFATNAVVHGLGESEAPIHGPGEFKPFFRNIREAFPDTHIDIANMVAQEDRVAVRMDISGTHLGNGLGIPPTGRKIFVHGIVIMQISGGQIVAADNIWDQHGMLRQLGIGVPAEDASKDRFFGEAPKAKSAHN